VLAQQAIQTGTLTDLVFVVCQIFHLCGTAADNTAIPEKQLNSINKKDIYTLSSS